MIIRFDRTFYSYLYRTTPSFLFYQSSALAYEAPLTRLPHHVTGKTCLTFLYTPSLTPSVIAPLTMIDSEMMVVELSLFCVATTRLVLLLVVAFNKLSEGRLAELLESKLYTFQGPSKQLLRRTVDHYFVVKNMLGRLLPVWDDRQSSFHWGTNK